uniref:Maco-A 94/2 33 n=1 Tax=Mamestra configurata nucleopolyhedrovirus TaxID=207830 RepID=A0A7G7Y811_NPVMC|nr:maco-A 94/2 33 [Mamestra configurata nucleopolyhedrovirus A]
MNIKFFVLLFCVDLIGCSCAEIKNARVKDLIKKLKGLKLPARGSLPPYLNPIEQFQEFQESQEPSTSSAPKLKRHHLVSGNQLKQLYKILLENSPETLIEMFHHIYYNLPAAWRDASGEYLEALWCLDDNVADDDLKNIDCEERVKNLYDLLFWRPDNIQVGPGDRFRDGGDGYDYDCFYLLRGAEMIYNIEFRDAVEAVIDADYTVTEEEHRRILQGNFNRLVRTSHNMITNRNVPRNYNPSEWMNVEKMSCRRHRYMFRNYINKLEKTFNLKPPEIRTVDRADQAISFQSMRRLVAWTESVMETELGRNKKLQKLANRIKNEQNKMEFTELVLDFMKTSNVQLNFPDYVDLILLYSNDVLTSSTIPADLWYKLYGNYLSYSPIMSQNEMKEELKKWCGNRNLITIFNTLRANKGASNIDSGYISDVKAILQYNIYFLNRYLENSDLTSDEMINFAKSIDTDNVTSTVKDFKELRKKDKDDDDEQDTKNLSTWHSLLLGVYRLHEDKHCTAQLNESVKKIVNSKMCADEDPTSATLLDIIDKTLAVEKISPDIKECSANMNIRGTTRIRAQRDVGDKSTQEKQLQLRQLVEEVYQNINSTYPYDRATVLYQMVANRMHPEIKKSLNLVCHIPDGKVVNSNCEGYRYPGCYWDQPALEKATIIMDKMTCHGLNILTFGIGYFFNKC